MLVLVEANGQVRDPDEDLGDQGSDSRLGRRLPGGHAMRTGLTEVVGEVAEQVMDLRADVRLLRGIAQEGGRDAELAAGLVGVTAQACELRLGERQVDQSVRPGDTLRRSARPRRWRQRWSRDRR